MSVLLLLCRCRWKYWCLCHCCCYYCIGVGVGVGLGAGAGAVVVASLWVHMLVLVLEHVFALLLRLAAIRWLQGLTGFALEAAFSVLIQKMFDGCVNRCKNGLKC